MAGEGANAEVRAARMDDAPTIAEIWHAGWQDAHTGHVPDELVRVRNRESFDVRAAQRVPDTAVATVGGEVAGFVMVADDEVEQVFVSRDHRGSGVANVLLVEAERLVRANGHAETWLAVVDGNARARRFYERNGWRDEGLFDYQASSDGGPITVPCRRYVKQLV
jgi:GNAT superfamily N-acetyltransferase